MTDKDLLNWTQSLCNSHNIPFTPSGVRQLISVADRLYSSMPPAKRKDNLRRAVNLLEKPGEVAQSVERRPKKAGVGGSTPSLSTIP
jgi:hypothetical protein